MKSLNQTEPYFVRCINPNKQKSSKIWNEKIVEHQLRCGGLLEALKVLKLGYPTRVPYKLLYEKYHNNVTNQLIKNMNEEAFSTSLLIAFDVNENDYELGLTKIFFKPSKAAILDTIMNKADKPLTPIQNEKITKYIVNKRCKQIIGSIRAFTIFRKLIRMKRAQQHWQFNGRVTSIIGASVIKHLDIARKQIKQRKEKEAAELMQTYFRSCYERKMFIRHCDKVKKATKMIWISYNANQQRRAMIEWLDNKVEETRRKNEMLRIEKARADAKAIEDAKIAQINKQKEDAAKEAAKKKEEELAKLRAKQAEQRAAEQRAAEEKAKEDQKRREEEEEKLLRDQVDIRKMEQKRGSTDNDKLKAMDERESKALKKLKKEREIEENMKDRKRQDIEARKKRARADKKRKMKKRYGVDIESDTESEEDEEEEEKFTDDEDEEEEEIEDIGVLLSRFHKIASMGQLFYRYTGSRSRSKPQDRVVKVSFDIDGKAKEISWGSGTRHIAFSEILYVAHGHWTPVFDVRKNGLDKDKCFSIIARDNKILDLEGSSKHLVTV